MEHKKSYVNINTNGITGYLRVIELDLGITVTGRSQWFTVIKENDGQTVYLVWEMGEQDPPHPHSALLKGSCNSLLTTEEFWFPESCEVV